VVNGRARQNASQRAVFAPLDPTDLEWIYLAPDYLSITVIVDSASHLAAKVVSDAN